jgi:DNA polymerase-4
MRKILHVDIDAFFCSVEELLDPLLKDKAFATGGTSDGRGVVTSCSYAARLHGVRSAMPMQKAMRMCRDLLTVTGHYEYYSRYSKRVMNIFQNITPLVEPISIDEAFLDVTDLPQDPKNIALDIQMKIRRETGLPSSIGAASNKLVAKIATNIGKSDHKKPTPPMAIKVISPGQEKLFLETLPIVEMWGIGPRSEKLLHDFGIVLIGDIQRIQIEKLENILGNFAYILKKRALGIDDRLVGNDGNVKSISNERTFFDNLEKKNEIYSIIKDLSEKVGRRLRKRGLSGRTVRLKIRWPNFDTITRQLTLNQPTNHDSVIFSSSKNLFEKVWAEGKGVRLIGICVSKLESDIHQLSLFNKNFEKEKMLLEAMDDLQERFGKEIINKGSSRN